MLQKMFQPLHMWFPSLFGVCELGNPVQETNGYPLLTNYCLAIARELRNFSEE
jgi:hypothetical protein